MQHVPLSFVSPGIFAALVGTFSACNTGAPAAGVDAGAGGLLRPITAPTSPVQHEEPGLMEIIAWDRRQFEEAAPGRLEVTIPGLLGAALDEGGLVAWTGDCRRRHLVRRHRR